MSWPSIRRTPTVAGTSPGERQHRYPARIASRFTGGVVVRMPCFEATAYARNLGVILLEESRYNPELKLIANRFLKHAL